MEDLSVDDARAFVHAVVQLASMADRVLPRESSPLTTRLQEHLGQLEEVLPNTSATFPMLERANVQLALDAYASSADVWEVIGLIGDIGNYGGVSLPSLVSGMWRGPGEAARQYVSVDIGVDETVECLRAGVILTVFDGEPIAAMIHTSERFMPEIVVEVVARRQDLVEGFLRRLRELMDEHNAFRGKVISFSYDAHGHFGITFSTVPAVKRDHVVLHEGDLEAIEDHAIGISSCAEAFVTTNRVDILEPALAARPGRIDQAIELDLPDAIARRRLIELYTGAGLDGIDADRLLARTQGAAPAFIKELARRATIIGLRTDAAVTSCLDEALDAMLDQSSPILRNTRAGPTA